jgi:hypothetical protein
MKFRKTTIAVALGLTLVAGAAFAGGIFVNGMPLALYPLTGSEQFGVDTQLCCGINPQSEAVSTQQMALFAPAIVALTDGTTIASDVSQGLVYSVTLAGNRTLSNPTNLVAGKQWKVLVKQDTTGSRTLAYGTLYYFPCGLTGASTTLCGLSTAAAAVGVAPTLTTSPGYLDVLTFLYNGSSILGTSSLGTP